MYKPTMSGVRYPPVTEESDKVTEYNVTITVQMTAVDEVHVKMLFDCIARFDARPVTLSSTEAEAQVGGWTPGTIAEALGRLERNGGTVQAQAIREASKNGGMIGRKQIFLIGGYPKQRMLRGFTKPVSRVVDAMKSEGLIPQSAVNLLEPTYNSGPRADGFRVPAQLVALIARHDENQ
jgi:hypothetical protein